MFRTYLFLCVSCNPFRRRHKTYVWSYNIVLLYWFLIKVYLFMHVSCCLGACRCISHYSYLSRSFSYSYNAENLYNELRLKPEKPTVLSLYTSFWKCLTYVLVLLFCFSLFCFIFWFLFIFKSHFVCIV